MRTIHLFTHKLLIEDDDKVGDRVEKEKCAIHFDEVDGESNLSNVNVTVFKK